MKILFNLTAIRVFWGLSLSPWNCFNSHWCLLEIRGATRVRYPTRHCIGLLSLHVATVTSLLVRAPSCREHYGDQKPGFACDWHDTWHMTTTPSQRMSVRPVASDQAVGLPSIEKNAHCSSIIFCDIYCDFKKPAMDIINVRAFPASSRCAKMGNHKCVGKQRYIFPR